MAIHKFQKPNNFYEGHLDTISMSTSRESYNRQQDSPMSSIHEVTDFNRDMRRMRLEQSSTV